VDSTPDPASQTTAQHLVVVAVVVVAVVAVAVAVARPPKWKTAIVSSGGNS